MGKLSDDLELWSTLTGKNCREWINEAKRLEAFEQGTLAGRSNDVGPVVKRIQQAASEILPALQDMIDAMDELQKVRAKYSANGSNTSNDVRG